MSCCANCVKDQLLDALEEAVGWNWLDESTPPPKYVTDKINSAVAAATNTTTVNDIDDLEQRLSPGLWICFGVVIVMMVLVVH